MDKYTKEFAKRVLRRGSLKWKPRNDAYKAARVDRGQYECNMCKKIFGRKEVELDHIIPVINEETGFTTFDEFIKRLYCPRNNFQVICKPCHEAKTLIGGEMRKHFKNKVKKKLDNKKKK